MDDDREVIRKDDKLFINYQTSHKQPQTQEILLRSEDYKGEPEFVEMGVGLTICPRQFESIRVEYKCRIHHDPGQEKRELAFDVAEFNCKERIERDVIDLHKSNVIKEHFLIPKTKDETIAFEAELEAEEQKKKEEERLDELAKKLKKEAAEKKKKEKEEEKARKAKEKEEEKAKKLAEKEALKAQKDAEKKAKKSMADAKKEGATLVKKAIAIKGLKLKKKESVVMPPINDIAYEDVPLEDQGL